MQEFYYRTEDGISGLVTAANEHAAHQVVKQDLENMDIDPYETDWRYERVDNLLGV